ncbi:hypothetical protein D3C81_1832910 [compost metagenome]
MPDEVVKAGQRPARKTVVGQAMLFKVGKHHLKRNLIYRAHVRQVQHLAHLKPARGRVIAIRRHLLLSQETEVILGHRLVVITVQPLCKIQIESTRRQHLVVTRIRPPDTGLLVGVSALQTDVD